MVDLLDEAQEDVRRERWMSFWRRVGGYFVAASVAVILVTVTTVFWQKHQEKQRSEAALAYLDATRALVKEDWDAAAASFASVADKNAEGIAGLAQMQQAKALAEAGKSEDALAAFTRVAGTKGADMAVRSLAAIQAAQLQVKQGADFAATEQTVQFVIANSVNPFRFHAQELLAYAALKAGDKERAETLLVAISTDSNAPESLRKRAAEQIAMLPAFSAS